MFVFVYVYFVYVCFVDVFVAAVVVLFSVVCILLLFLEGSVDGSAAFQNFCFVFCCRYVVVVLEGSVYGFYIRHCKIFDLNK